MFNGITKYLLKDYRITSCHSAESAASCELRIPLLSRLVLIYPVSWLPGLTTIAVATPYVGVYAAGTLVREPRGELPLVTVTPTYASSPRPCSLRVPRTLEWATFSAAMARISQLQSGGYRRFMVHRDIKFENVFLTTNHSNPPSAEVKPLVKLTEIAQARHRRSWLPTHCGSRHYVRNNAYNKSLPSLSIWHIRQTLDGCVGVRRCALHASDARLPFDPLLMPDTPSVAERTRRRRRWVLCVVLGKWA
ncbi:hypothetical protein EDB85DRAFT_1900978 [Lactarius pseudohatsudake]|nr:hypothetical protein EDB85DRAFT_1900978 [Lactarius pseudohatsudake]